MYNRCKPKLHHTLQYINRTNSSIIQYSYVKKYFITFTRMRKFNVVFFKVCKQIYFFRNIHIEKNPNPSLGQLYQVRKNNTKRKQLDRHSIFYRKNNHHLYKIKTYQQRKSKSKHTANTVILIKVKSFRNIGGRHRHTSNRRKMALVKILKFHPKTYTNKQTLIQFYKNGRKSLPSTNIQKNELGSCFHTHKNTYFSGTSTSSIIAFTPTTTTWLLYCKQVIQLKTPLFLL